MPDQTPGDDEEYPAKDSAGHQVSAEEVDRRFADMVAAFGPAPGVDEPEQSSADAERVEDETETGEQAPTPAEPETEQQDPYRAQWRTSQRPPDPDDDHFTPEPPPPLPAGDLSFWTIVGGLTLGPLLVFFSLVIPLLDGDLWTIIGAALCVLGFVTLIRRAPGGHGPDRGAQV